MKDKKNICVFIILFSFLASSCQNTDFNKKVSSDYEKMNSSFDGELVQHFPNEIPKGYIGGYLKEKSVLADFCFGPNELILIARSQKEEYISLNQQFRKLSKAIYNPEDSNLLLVFSYCDVLKVEENIYRNQETTERKKLAKRNITTSNTLPVPIFEIDAYHNDKNSCGLSDDFKIFVLEAKSGKYLEEKYLQECECMPEKWKHGFSRGITANDKEHIIIYWLAVW